MVFLAENPESSVGPEKVQVLLFMLLPLVIDFRSYLRPRTCRENFQWGFDLALSG